jgi:uncharacterized membrane protein YphA (DoxX/SURF4 family)
MILLKYILTLMPAYIFFFSSITKVNDYSKHLEVVKSYNILPHSLIKFVTTTMIIVELFASVIVIIDIATFYGIICLIFLTLIYTLAIQINLLRGRRDLSCGCGGVLGDHKLSYKLVIRNSAILGLLLLSLTFSGDRLSLITYLYLNLFVTSLFFLYMLLIQIMNLKNKIKELIK